MADTLATLIVKLKADTAEMTTDMKRAMDSLDQFAVQTVNMSEATRALGPNVTGLSTSLRSFDGVLSSLGIHIGPEIKALGELGNVAGKTAGQLGAIATGGFVAAAALGGFKLGRMISEWLDLDEQIGNATAKLLGFGDVAGEVAGAKLDVLARATKIAGIEITNYGEALRIINAEHERFAASLQTPAANFARVRGEAAAAQREYRGLSEEMRINIERMLEWGQSSTEIDRLLKLQTGTVDVLIERNKLKAEQDKIAADAADKHAQAIQRIVDAQQRFIELAPLKPKDVTIDFQPTGAFKTHLDEAAGAREHAEALAQVEQEMKDNLLIIGQYPSAHQAAAEAATAHTDAAITGFHGLQAAALSAQSALQIAVPRDFDWTKAYSDAGNPFTSIVHPSISGLGGSNRASGGVTVNIHDSILDTPEGVQRMADKVGQAALSRLRGSGVGVR